MIENGQDPIEIQQQNALMRQQERKARELSELTFKKIFLLKRFDIQTPFL